MRNFKTKIGKQERDNHADVQDLGVVLVVISGSNLGEVFPLDKSPFVIGRNQDSDIISNDPLMSREHAQFVFSEKGSKWKVIDMDSTNGTYVNFQKKASKTLVTGDKISIGKTIFKFLGSDLIEKKFHNELYKTSIMDGLTQICSRSRFDECLEKAILGIRDGDKKLVLCMIDIDFFKKINDSHGHQAGDYVLRTLTLVMKKVIRRQDILARYGGEEFCLLLVNTTLAIGALVAEKIRKAVEEYVFQFEGVRMSVTISMGLSVFQEGWTPEKFIEKADKKLYVSKKSGRNKVSLPEKTV